MSFLPNPESIRDGIGSPHSPQRTRLSAGATRREENLSEKTRKDCGQVPLEELLLTGQAAMTESVKIDYDKQTLSYL